MARPAARPPAGRRLGALDGLRAIAVLAVIVYHLNVAWLPGGYLGVDVFFVLSGFLITSGLVRDHDDRGGIRLGRFWLRRFRRLIPALWTMVLVCTAALALFPPDLRAALGRQLLGAFTYTSNWLSIAAHDSYFAKDTPLAFVHLWSLAIEEQFYLVWPLLLFAVLALRRAGRVGIALVLAIASGLGMAVMYVPGADPSPVYFGTLTHLFGLMLGAGLAFARPLYSAGGLGQIAPRHPLTAGVVNLVALGSLAVLGVAFALLGDQLPFTYQGGIFLVSALVVVIIATLGDQRSVVTKVLQTQPFRLIGRLSYGMYLWHWPVIIMVRHLVGGQGQPLPTALVIVLSLGLTMLASWLSYRFIEQPILRLGFRQTLKLVHTRLVVAGGMRRHVIPIGAAAAVSVLCIVSLVSAPDRSSAQQYVETGAEYANMASAKAPAIDPHGAPPAEPLFPSTQPIAQIHGTDMIAAGDSVMLASARQISQSYPGILIDAQVARQSGDTFRAARQLLADNRDRRVLVVHAGTNGGIDADALEDLVTWCGPNRRIVLVDIFAARSWEQPGNATLESIAAQHPQTVAVAHWHAAVQDHVDELAGDQIHPGDAAAGRYVASVTDALGRLGVTVVG
ncbi:acyltransferase family protein [Pseudoclavibacter sp. 13-3]|uniref:acyltransferase family protein n=1 Tax=Pseudoclavibacter sp. 13-3 TaxID=2901228 RepID=UPI001E54BAAE|nr:acyltransferase [Pseudoclavibacter sp. 13-3]